MAIYADVLLALNFAVDYLILKGVCCFCARAAKNFRLILGAAVGAVGSLIIFCPISSEAVMFLFRAASAAAMSAAVFYPCAVKTLLKCTAAVFFESFVVSGILMLWQIAMHPVGVINKAGAIYFDIAIPALITCAVMGYIAACFVSGILARRFSAEQFCEVTVINDEASVSITALIDTGNSLVEPFSGAPVIVCELAAIKSVVPTEIASFDIESPPQTGVRLVPYKTMDSEGLLPAFIPKMLLVKEGGGTSQMVCDCCIAVTTAKLGDEYHAICNPKVFLHQEKEGDVCYEKSV